MKLGRSQILIRMNLGPCVIEICTYIRVTLIHFQDNSTYATITEEEEANMYDDLYIHFFAWTVQGQKKKTFWMMK